MKEIHVDYYLYWTSNFTDLSDSRISFIDELPSRYAAIDRVFGDK